MRPSSHKTFVRNTSGNPASVRDHHDGPTNPLQSVGSRPREHLRRRCQERQHCIAATNRTQSASFAETTGHHAGDSGARLALVKALASLDPRSGLTASTIARSSAADRFCVKAGLECRPAAKIRHAEADDSTGWPTHGPPDGGSVSWLAATGRCAISCSTATSPWCPFRVGVRETAARCGGF
jgi:hypothetical protein